MITCMLKLRLPITVQQAVCAHIYQQHCSECKAVIHDPELEKHW